MTDDQIRARQTRDAWGRIEAWLEAHAPRSHRRLPAPAAEEEIQAVERELDVELPADLRAFYALHNGTGPDADFAWPTWDGPLPIPPDQWDPERDPSGYLLPEGGIGPVGRLPYWVGGPAGCAHEDAPEQRYVAFVASDPDGFYGLFADCTPGAAHGTLGWYAEAEAPSPGAWPSFAAYLTEVADALYAPRGAGADRAAPGVVEGCLQWDDPQSPVVEGWRPFHG
ncbi:SMI1/KNR4 family protein [Streptomyces sp. NPDC039016]|uniref:SMI1/KNR4 family protein n=1 Tax=unclassified Streptomyces TaxID=2593676 RepID=UPI0033F984EC